MTPEAAAVHGVFASSRTIELSDWEAVGASHERRIEYKGPGGGILMEGCEIKPLPSRGVANIYQASCFGSSHKVMDVVCVAGRCTVSHFSHRRNEIPASR